MKEEMERHEEWWMNKRGQKKAFIKAKLEFKAKESTGKIGFLERATENLWMSGD